MACLTTSIGFGLVFGAITGAILSKLAVYQKNELFEDKTFWEILPSVEDEEESMGGGGMLHSNRKGKFTLELSRMDESFMKSPLVM